MYWTVVIFQGVSLQTTLTYQAHGMNSRRTRSVQYPLVQLPRSGPTYESRELDNHHCMGGPHIVSCSLDRCKTLPGTAIHRFGRRGLFHGVDQNPHALLCSVSSSFLMCLSLPPTMHALALLLFLA